MLHPNDRCVRAKLQLFLRLWVARQKYEHLTPHGKTATERFRFHLAHLESCWSKVVEFQRVLGLEAVHFAPRDQFEKIYVVSAYADREMQDPQNTVVDVHSTWAIYRDTLGRLSHSLNPFEFGEACSHCYRNILELNRPPAQPPGNVIPLDAAQLSQLEGRPAPERLKMAEK